MWWDVSLLLCYKFTAESVSEKISAKLEAKCSGIFSRHGVRPLYQKFGGKLHQERKL